MKTGQIFKCNYFIFLSLQSRPNTTPTAPSRHSAPPASIAPISETPTKSYQPPNFKVAEIPQETKEVPTTTAKIEPKVFIYYFFVHEKVPANDEVECEYCGKIGKPEVILKHMDICPCKIKQLSL